MKNDSITLIGMAGSGKSTVGEILASMLKWQYADFTLHSKEQTKEEMMDMIIKILRENNIIS